MIPLRGLPFALTLFASLALTQACSKVPLVAPTGSSIVLVAGATSLPINGTTTISATVLEPSGTVPQDGTTVSFLTTLGSIQPSDAETSNGRVTVTFMAGTVSGTASITAISGGATVKDQTSTSTTATGTTTTATGLKIAIGVAAASRLTVSANPATVPALGGSTTVSANVFDANGNTLASVPVTFSTTAGTLSPAIATSDANGVAQTTLATSQQATVTANVGAQGGSSGTSGGTATGPSGTVTVNVSAAPTLVIVPPSTAPSAGLPASFTFTVTTVANGAVARSLSINWGDGSTQELGAISGNAVVSHVYTTTGNKTVTATLVDSTGNTTIVSTAVTVIPVPRPTVIVTATPGAVGTKSATFSIQVTAPQGIGIVTTSISYGDGQTDSLGGATSTTKFHDYTPTTGAGTYAVTVTVVDTAGQTTLGTTTVTVS